ncbi:molybdopterin-dependent oxidoreductase [Azospirillum sp. ST 5-10]|uniref:molybdopterin-dependent oxidoreductase n=1 Tax=unclassified Azospirillum TaxID=2630922 RepID=UPI003F4A1E4E
MTVVEKVGFCTLCRSRCGTVNVVEDGRLVAVRPNPAHPTGKALCPKGRAAPEIAHSARRLTTPLRRTAPKGAADAGFVPIGWDEALDEIAARLGAIRRESGPEAVAFAVTSGSSSSMSDSLDWVQRFIRGFGSPNTCFSTEICNWHKDNAHAFTFGCGLPVADVRNSDLVLLWGHNPANVWLAQAEAIGAARARGARLAVIDPRPAGSARDADLWLRVRPGTDAALALGLARRLIERDAFDDAFVREWTNAPLLVREDDGRFLRGRDVGLDTAPDAVLAWDETAGAAVPAAPHPAAAALRARVTVAGIPCRTAFDLYAEAAAPYDPATVERLTGVPAGQVEALADAIAAARSVCYHGWTGVGQHSNATQTERAIATLYALTGSFDAPGGNVRMPALPVPALHSMAMIPEETRARTLGLAERPLGPPADGWITASDLYDAVLDRRPYPVRALFALGSNLLVSHPAPERGRRALEALEFQVHVDLFLNPTAATADIVLPASSPWEIEALRLGFEISPEAQELVQLRQPIVPRQGDSRSDLWIVFQLAKRLGMGDLFFDGAVEAGWNHLLAPLGLDVDTLRRHPEGVRVPLPHRHRKHREAGFATETGRAELYSERLHRHGYDPVPRFVPPTDAADEAFPLTALSANVGWFCHSQHRGITALRRKRPEPVAELHPDTAAAHGIADGDRMRIVSRSGAMEVRAALNPSLAREVVAADYGWWQAAPDLGLPGYFPADGPPTANFNSLVDERRRDPLSGALAMRSTACRVERASAGPWRGFRRFLVAERRAETAEVVALRLVPEDGGPLASFRPGQFIGLRIGGVVRSYSLTSSATGTTATGGATAPRDYAIAVRRIAGGALSPTVADALRPGDVVEVQAPSGDFVLPLANEFPVVLIAGGIGITPFLSYLETLTGAPGEPHVVLHHGCRDGASHPFAARLAALSDRLPNLTLVTHYSRPRAGDRCDRRQRFAAAAIDEELIRARARFYVCAGDAMMDEVTAGLRARGVPPFEIFRERFRSPDAIVGDGPASCSVRFARAGRTLTWTPEAGPLLAFAERAGVDLPSGCRVGQCESCVVDVLSGGVRHLVDPADLEEGRCLACQAVPTGDLVLDA